MGMNLGAAFLEALAASGASSVEEWSSAPDLDARLADLCKRGRAAHPGLELADETFVRHLGNVMARDRAGAPSVDDRCTEDLFLACACLARMPRAAEAFDEHGRNRANLVGRLLVRRRRRNAASAGTARGRCAPDRRSPPAPLPHTILAAR
jgi:RNA polymerase sigma-70 factor (ECF subfamily)